ncbi:MAG: spore germination protein [Firmicutes bacterium]|jgi:spore germination protein KA|nr:spore germination protein [Bacillota bacterium]
MSWIFNLIRGRPKYTGEISKLRDDRLDVGEREAIEETLKFGTSLRENINMIKAAVGPSPDVAIREMRIGQGRYEAAVVYIQDLVDKGLTESLLRMLGLGTLETPVGKAPRGRILEELKDRLIASVAVNSVRTFTEAWEDLTKGHALVILDGDGEPLTCGVQGYKTRTPEEPPAEVVVRGAREGFVESIATNISLLRRWIRTPNLWIEPFTLGHLTRTPVAIAYIKGLASEELVQEVRQRISRIETDSILGSGYVEEFIQDTPFTLFPLVLRTERPDRVAGNLLDGKVAVFTENTPFVLIVPFDYGSLFQAPDDYHEPVPLVTALTVIRLLAFWGSLLLPGAFVAVLTFHQQLFPTQLLLKITGDRAGIPFPVVAEVFAMELVFELLREAGLRLPRAVGSAVTIVGALVLGEAAINAGFVSPSVIIVVAMTAISSFVLPTFSFDVAARLLRFVFIILGGVLGLFGIQLGFLTTIVLLTGLRSFGLPYFKPMGPMILADWKDSHFRAWAWMRITRPKLAGSREPIRAPRGQMPRPGLEKEETEKGSGRSDRGGAKRQ